MLSQEENELLTRVGPGTPMGALMRRYWQPALLARELAEPDGPPVRVRLLGERLVAFRDTAGRIGLLDESCAHRCASLFVGRNEQDGLRCVFHGWKYDVTGQCVDQMNEPVPFSAKIRVTSYPTVELGGLIWTYLGPPEKRPPEPRFDWTQAPESHRYVSKTWEECNWLQALEGGIDTSHAPILHRALTNTTQRGGIAPAAMFVRGKPATLEVDASDYGYLYAGIRPLGDDKMYVRTYHWVLPFTQIRPFQVGARDTDWRPHIAGHFWVPMDDENCMTYNWQYNYGPDAPPLTEDDRIERGSGRGPGEQDASFRKRRNKDNDWLIDRQVQRSETFTGIDGVHTQDHAVQESMGPIVDRTREHLGPADKAIIATRRILLDAVRTVAEGGDPPGLGTSYYGLRAIEQVLPRDADWRAALGPRLYYEPALAR
ncbi:MAG TPA: Rieske 2Fe-2S domain-containing protein [Chloroflexota bacterium]|jgi:phenylpropionate dioxygenase-like ring-hydroxylating dioxygenase large terminal subunit